MFCTCVFVYHRQQDALNILTDQRLDYCLELGNDVATVA